MLYFRLIFIFIILTYFTLSLISYLNYLNVFSLIDLQTELYIDYGLFSLQPVGFLVSLVYFVKLSLFAIGKNKIKLILIKIIKNV